MRGNSLFYKIFNCFLHIKLPNESSTFSANEIELTFTFKIFKSIVSIDVV